MPEPRRREWVLRASLLAFLAACLFVAARVLALPSWSGPLVCLAAFPLPLRRLPRRLTTAATVTLAALLLALFVAGFVYTAYPVVDQLQTKAALKGLALAMTALGVLFAVGIRGLSPGRHVIPMGVGVVLAAALCVEGEGVALVMPTLVPWPLAALVVYLFLSGDTLVPRGARGIAARRVLRAGLSLTIAAAVAVGFAQLLPRAQPVVEGLFASAGDAAVSGIGGGDSRLGAVEELALDHRVALRVWGSESRYLRVRVATSFDGTTWRAALPASLRRVVAPSTVDAPPDWTAAVPGSTFRLVAPPGSSLTALWGHVLMAQDLASDALPAPAGTELVRVPDPQIEVDGAGIPFAPLAAQGLFGFSALRHASPLPETPEMLAACLTLPPHVDVRLRALAAQLSADAASPWARIAATDVYLQTHCRYALRVGRFETSDPVAEFVFEKRRGYCEYFASAAALLLRLQGVPARYVTGFSGRAPARQGDHDVVLMSDAHAWVEAYVEGRGWEQVDPTPGDEYDEIHARHPSGWSRGWEAAQARWALLAAAARQAWRTGSVRWLWQQILATLRFLLLEQPRVTTALGLLALGLLWGPRLRRWLVRRRQAASLRQAAGAPPALRSVFFRLERLLARRGVPRPETRPPLEHVRALPPEKVGPELRTLAEDIVVALYAALYARQAPPASAIEALERRLRRVERAAD